MAISVCLLDLCRMEEAGSGDPTSSSPLPQAGDGSQLFLDLQTSAFYGRLWWLRASIVLGER